MIVPNTTTIILP